MYRGFQMNMGESGNVSMLFALAAVPLILSGGMAIDYLRASSAQTELQNAVDGAALAIAGSDLTSAADLRKIGSNYFVSNFKDSLLQRSRPEYTINKDNITVSVSFDYPTVFMSLAGYPTMKIGSTAEVGLGQNGKAELVLVLDYSRSMVTNSKYVRMKDAASKMLNSLSNGSGSSTLKVGLVPFSAMVRTSMAAAYVSQSSATATWTGCTQDRKYPYNLSVSTPDGSAKSQWGYFDAGTENSGLRDCTAYGTNNLDIAPLTSDISAARKRLSDMIPVGNTNIPLGVEFGWNLLDSAAPFSEAASYSDGSTKKFMVILTDGVQTSKQWGSDDLRSVANGNTNLVTLCSNVRAKSITIFAIAYDITDPKVTDLLKQCAPDNYFEASTSGGEIDTVFKAITKRIKKSTIRLAR